jgi:hypothetical protein
LEGIYGIVVAHDTHGGFVKVQWSLKPHGFTFTTLSCVGNDGKYNIMLAEHEADAEHEARVARINSMSAMATTYRLDEVDGKYAECKDDVQFNSKSEMADPATMEEAGVEEVEMEEVD